MVRTLGHRRSPALRPVAALVVCCLCLSVSACGRTIPAARAPAAASTVGVGPGADPIVDAALKKARASTGSIVGYAVVFYRRLSAQRASLARYVVMKDGRMFILNPATAPDPPASPLPERVQPESSAERAARERTLASAASRVSAVHTDLAGVTPGVESYVVVVQWASSGSLSNTPATLLVSADGRRVDPFLFGGGGIGYEPWP